MSISNYSKLNNQFASLQNPYFYGTNSQYQYPYTGVAQQQIPVTQDIYTNTTAIPSFKGNEEEKSKNQSLGFFEGLGLIAKGGFKQAGGMITSIVQNPLKTLCTVGATTAGLMALPIIGIPTAVGGAGLAIGFAGLAGVKGLSHTFQFIQNKSNGDNDEARKNLEQLGGDTFDLALSAPFIPKGLKEIQRFTKYGKVAYNTELVSNISNAKGIKAKFGELTKGGREVTRKINYMDATETELAKLSGISDAEKTRIRQYIQEYDVPREKIADVVMDQWAREHGISAKPTVKYASMTEGTEGAANRANCTITINDHKHKVPSSSDPFNKFEQIGEAELIDDVYHIKYRNNETNEIINETLSKAMYDERKNLLEYTKTLSPEAREISTLVHERTHIHDYARIAQSEGREAIQGITEEAWQKYVDMMRDMPPVESGSQEAAEIHQLLDRTNYHTTAGYIKNPLELNARAAQAELHARSEFQALDKVFKTNGQINKNTPTAFNTIVLNSARSQSAVT